MFTLKQLELFLHLGRSEKIIETARHFDLSQSAVSMAIKELERLLGEPLFERIGKRLVLNARGSLLMREAAPHVEALQHLYIMMNEECLGGELRIAASVTIAEYLLPRVVSDYRELNPNVTILLQSVNSTEVLKRIKNGDADIGFIEGSCDDPEVNCRRLMHDELIVVSSDGLLAKQGPWYIDQLARRNWILREKGSGTLSVFLDAIAPVDRELNVWMQLERIEAIKNFLLLRKEYISVLPRISVERELDEKLLFEVAVRGHVFERDFMMISRKKQSDTRLLLHFQEYLLSSAGLQ